MNKKTQGKGASNVINIKPGSEVYGTEGESYEYVCRLPGDLGCVVKPVFYSEDDSYYGQPIIIDRVWPSPPKQKHEQRIAELLAEIDVLSKKRLTLSREVRRLEEGKAEVLKNIKEYETLKHIEDFLAGEISHFVITRYSTIEIVDAKKELESRDETVGKPRILRLLTLYGLTGGNLQWRLNRYSDGSGGEEEVMPFTSFDEAEAYAKRVVSEKMAALAKSNNQYVATGLMDSAKRLGVEVPAELERVTKANNVRVLEGEIADLEKKLDAKRAARLEIVTVPPEGIQPG
jgi:hypothetical protein